MTIWIIVWVISGWFISIWYYTAAKDFKISDWPILVFGLFGPFAVIYVILF
jgi:hypothetical protein